MGFRSATGSISRKGAVIQAGHDHAGETENSAHWKDRDSVRQVSRDPSRRTWSMIFKQGSEEQEVAAMAMSFCLVLPFAAARFWSTVVGEHTTTLTLWLQVHQLLHLLYQRNNPSRGGVDCVLLLFWWRPPDGECGVAFLAGFFRWDNGCNRLRFAELINFD